MEIETHQGADCRQGVLKPEHININVDGLWAHSIEAEFLLSVLRVANENKVAITTAHFACAVLQLHEHARMRALSELRAVANTQLLSDPEDCNAWRLLRLCLESVVRNVAEAPHTRPPHNLRNTRHVAPEESKVT